MAALGKPEGKVIQIACGENHSLALLDDGTVKGWVIMSVNR